MKPENQVCSLDLAKQLNELGVKQDGMHTWQRRHRAAPYILDQGGMMQEIDKDAWFSAFTVAELGEMLTYEGKHFHCGGSEKKHGKWQIWLYSCNPLQTHQEDARTEADARAKMVVYLIENNLFTLQ